MYDRQLLLSDAKRNAVLDLDEVQRYGLDSCGDADYVTIYGLRPSDWYAKGLDATSLTELTSRFDWSALSIYGLNAPGENHGILLGTKRWVSGRLSQ